MTYLCRAVINLLKYGQMTKASKYIMQLKKAYKMLPMDLNEFKELFKDDYEWMLAAFKALNWAYIEDGIVKSRDQRNYE